MIKAKKVYEELEKIHHERMQNGGDLIIHSVKTERLKMEIHLGMKVFDKISGFDGIAVGKAEFLTGRVDIQVQPLVRDGRFVDSQWIPQENLIEFKKEKENG